jgi:hypothetical protein
VVTLGLKTFATCLVPIRKGEKFGLAIVCILPVELDVSVVICLCSLSFLELGPICMFLLLQVELVSKTATCVTQSDV